jgi:hypothetical protein
MEFGTSVFRPDLATLILFGCRKGAASEDRYIGVCDAAQRIISITRTSSATHMVVISTADTREPVPQDFKRPMPIPPSAEVLCGVVPIHFLLERGLIGSNGRVSRANRHRIR